MPVNAPTTTSTPPSRGILLVEEYPALGVAISSALRKFAPLHGVQVAHSFADAETLAEAMQPELFLLDLDPPPFGEIAFLDKVKKRFPEARVLVIAAGTSPEVHAARGTAGAIQFIEKPFDLAEFGAAIQALVGPWAGPPAGGVRGTLRDLNVIDVVQLKCLALSTAIVRLETSGQRSGEIHFLKGEVAHAITETLTGLAALEEMDSWQSPVLRETDPLEESITTIHLPWPKLVLDLVRARRERDSDAAVSAPVLPRARPVRTGKKILIVDDTEMLLIFVADVLGTADQTFQIITAPTGAEGIRLAASARPDLVLLDYSLTDMTGDKVCRALIENETTARIPILMMSGHLTELARTAETNRNVVAALPKPFLSGALINAVEKALASGLLPKAPPRPPAELKPLATPSPVVAPPAEVPQPNGHGPGSDEIAVEPVQPPPPPVSPAPVAVAPPLPVAVVPSAPPPRPTPVTVVPIAAPPPMMPAPARSLETVAVSPHVRQTEVNVTFALAIVSLQLSSALRMQAAQLQPYDRVVSLELGPRQALAGPALQTGFRLGPITLSRNGRIETLRLIPTRQVVHQPVSGNSLSVGAINFPSLEKERNVQFIAAPEAAMRVRMTAPFELVTVELSAAFEVDAVVLRARGTEVVIHNRDTGPGAPFDLQQIQLDPAAELTALFARSLA
ncbi:MAG: response regulator [Spartobacteria bacterium]